MSAASGTAAAAIALLLAFFAIGQPVWEWRFDMTTELEVWSYRMMGVDHVVENRSTGTTTVVSYNYFEVPAQPQMAGVFITLFRWFSLAVILAIAGTALLAVTLARKLSGIYPGLAYLGACGTTLYAALALVFMIPDAAIDISTPGGQIIPGFRGQFGVPGAWTLTWGPLAGWFLLLGMGLLCAGATSELWHVRPEQARVLSNTMLTSVPARAQSAMAAASENAHEPVIEEVFVIAPSGLLVKHLSRSLLSDKDRDVVGSMISVVSNFVQEAFTEKDGDVQEILLGGHRFIMYNEGGLVIAVMATQGEKELILRRLKHLALALKDRYGERLTKWSGEAIEGIEDEIAAVLEPFHIPPPPS